MLGAGHAFVISWSMALCVVLGACAGGPKLPGLPAPGVGGQVDALTTGSLGGSSAHQPLPSAEIYARIARGANACWFGPRGRLGKTHILHADAAPSMSGGAVEIVVHERAVDQPKPWGYKAYRVQLTETPGLDGTPGGGGTTIAVENSRLSESDAALMGAEVLAWAGGAEGCRDAEARAQPSAPAPAMPAAAPPAR